MNGTVRLGISVLLFIASIVPLFYTVYFIVTFNVEPSQGEWGLYYAIHEYVTYTLVVMILVYQFIIVKNKNMKNDQKILFSLLLYFGNAVVMPYYWFRFIWKASR